MVGENNACPWCNAKLVRRKMQNCGQADPVPTELPVGTGVPDRPSQMQNEKGQMPLLLFFTNQNRGVSLGKCFEFDFALTRVDNLVIKQVKN